MIWPFLSGSCRSGLHNEVKMAETIKGKGGGNIVRLAGRDQMG
jgi:hypothetical protein